MEGQSYMSKLTLEINDPYGAPRRYTIEIGNWDVTAEQLIEEMLKPLLFVAGYAPETVKEIFND